MDTILDVSALIYSVFMLLLIFVTSAIYFIHIPQITSIGVFSDVFSLPLPPIFYIVSCFFLSGNLGLFVFLRLAVVFNIPV